MFGIDIQAIIAFIFLVLVFLLCREIICWYWKINLANRNLEQHTLELVVIKELLKKILAQLESAHQKAIQVEEQPVVADNKK